MKTTPHIPNATIRNDASASQEGATLSDAPKVPPPPYWQYGTDADDFENRSMIFGEALKQLNRDGALSAVEIRMHFAQVIKTQSIHSRRCSNCGDWFSYRGQWDYAEPAPEPPSSCFGCALASEFTALLGEPQCSFEADYYDTEETFSAEVKRLTASVKEQACPPGEAAECVRALKLQLEEKEKQRNTKDRARRQQIVDEQIPPEYLVAIKPAKLLDPVAFQLVQDWLQRYKMKAPKTGGMLLFGPTGLAKTRSMYRMLFEAMDPRKSIFDNFIATTAPKFKDAIIKTMIPGSTREDKEVRESFETADALFIDDLHQAKLSPAYAAALYEIVEARTSYRKPIFFTTQVSGERFLRKMAGDDPELYETAEAVVRRIRDYCTVIEFVQP